MNLTDMIAQLLQDGNRERFKIVPQEDGSLEVRARPRATLSAIVTRKDGTIEDLGEIWSGDVEVHS